MKTQNQENSSNTTTMISIPACSASQTLKSLHINNISCKYMGIDQSGRILMQINFDQQQKELIRELTNYMEKSEELVAEFAKAFNQSIEKLCAEAEKELTEKIKAFKLKRKNRSETALTTTSNGEQ
ncbi:MAG: hypothetical protein HY062_19090 [Bacteroidetes bacterium]|nr:hypothetical protein [Bacteroidota bacterium]